MKRLKPYLPIIIIIALSISAWLLDVQHYLNFEKLKAHQHMLEIQIEEHRALSILAYSGIYIVVVGLSLPAASLMTIIGGFLWGQWLGTMLVVISATFGGSILFLSARMASKELIAQKAGVWVKKMQHGFQENAFYYLLTLRLIPLFSFFAINLVAAFLQIPFRTFFLGTLIGIVPGSFVYVSIGVALHDVIQKPDITPNLILDPKILIALTGLGILALLPVIYKRFIQHRSR